MDKIELEKRTKQFAIRIIKFAATLPYGKIGDVIRYQLVKAGTSVGANYREANRAESRNDFIHKIGIVEKEASESQYWLEICDEAKLGDPQLAAGRIGRTSRYLYQFRTNRKSSKGLTFRNSKFAIRNSYVINHRRNPID
jgi:four helix bundle protein